MSPRRSLAECGPQSSAGVGTQSIAEEASITLPFHGRDSMDGYKGRDTDEGALALMNFKAMLKLLELRTAMLQTLAKKR